MPETITFLAVSGVRVRNTLLDTHAVTLPGFVHRGRTIASLPSLGLLTIAALTPPGYDLHYEDVIDPTDAEIDALPGDLVAIGALTARIDVAYRIADRLRGRGVTVVFGGLHAKVLPREVAQHADAVAVGEGEDLWPRIVADWERGSLRRFYMEDRPGTYDLARAPLPRYDLLDMERYNRITVQTSRGCPHDCEFCAASRLFGRYRRKPVPLVLRDIDAIRARWPRPFVEFADDNTFADPAWGTELLDGLRGRGVRWFTETDVSVADHVQLLDRLAPAGCRQLLIGFESPRRASLDGLDARNWKLRRRDGYLRAIERIQTRGVSVNGTFIVGNDADTPDVFPEIEAFVRESGLAEVQVTVLTPFPGTRLAARLAAEGRLLTRRYHDRCTLFDATFTPKNMSLEQLEAGMNWLFGRLYSDAAVQERKRGFLAMARSRRRAS
ncbi:MAG: B12-binding domain-containing radical SAM protein [Candidatus Brocadiae bacterium]|nr:B12-binding domain-containing radical SAM protein [Candidatus Brocadiia bacterium]